MSQEEDKSVRRRVSILLLIFSVFGLGLVFWEISQLTKKTHSQIISEFWKKDIERLEWNDQLPEAWKQIGVIVLDKTIPPVDKWVNQIDIPFEPIPGGLVRLEVSLLPWENIQSKKSGFILQHTLIDRESGELIYEFGRTFYWPKHLEGNLDLKSSKNKNSNEN